MASEYEVCQAKTCDPFDLKKLAESLRLQSLQAIHNFLVSHGLENWTTLWEQNNIKRDVMKTNSPLWSLSTFL